MTAEEVKERPVDATGNPIYRVPESNLPALVEKVTKLNKRAKRLGVEPLVMTELGEEFETRKRNGKEFVLRFVNLTVVGTCPKVNGWTFTGTVQHDEAGNILRVVPGFEESLPQKYRTAETLCEHCGVDRKRRDTYILRSDAGDWKQVGRSCLQDFLRTSNPAGMAEWSEMLAWLDADLASSEEESDSWGSGGGTRWIPQAQFLAQVSACTRTDGWCSRTEARNSFDGKRATADDALDFFDSKWVRNHEKYVAARAVSEWDTQHAAAAITWAQELPADVNNDYLWNIRVISHKEAIDYRTAGISGSIISAYNRHLEREVAKKYERDNPSEYFGTVGERAIYTFTIIGLKYLESDYGVTTMVRFRDDAGNKAVWFASGEKQYDIDQKLTVKATVKAHEEFKGHKQTMLSRVTEYDAEFEAKVKAYAKAAKKVMARYKKTHVCEHNTGAYKDYFMPPEIAAMDDYPARGAFLISCCQDCKAAWTTQSEVAI